MNSSTNTISLVRKGIPTVIALALFSFILAACDSGSSQPYKIPTPPQQTTVVIPNPSGDGSMFYHGAVVLTKSTGYVKFKTAEGATIEHSGQYQIKTESQY